MERIRFTESLDLDVDEELWCCNRCGCKIGSARDNYKKGCLIYNRDPSEIYPRVTNETIDFIPNKNWIRIIEFYCPSCGTMLEVENLPPGYPITYDIEVDIDKLKKKLREGFFIIENGKLRVAR